MRGMSAQPVTFVWPVKNTLGQDLLNTYIRPLLAKHNVSLVLPTENDTRLRMGKAINRSHVLILDVSVEDGHIYHKYNELPKVLNHILICSRTPLPRNVHAFHQIAPSYGQTFTNSQIADWLEETFPQVLERNREMSLWQRIAGKYWNMSKDMSEQQRLRKQQVGSFISYRGTHWQQANDLADQLRNHTNLPVTLIQPRELATDAECMTRQRMWEVVVRLMDRIHYAQANYIYVSDNYFDSFWTRSEILAIAYTRKQWRNVRLESKVVRDVHDDLSDLDDFDTLGIPALTDGQIQRLARITSNSDPGTMGPESVEVIRERSQGPLGELPYFQDTIWSERWWNDVMVPCPSCKPRHSQASEIDWERHLAIEDLWYFPIQKEILQGDAVSIDCPTCGTQITLNRLALPRTLWVPGPRNKPWPETLQMIEPEYIWEAT